MKKLILMGLLLAAMTLISAPAFAVPVTLNIDELYDWGRLYSYVGDTTSGTYTTTNSNPAYFGVGGDTAVGRTIASGTSGNADNQEDTWGVGNVASIKNLLTNSVIFQENAGQELTFMFYGFDDDKLVAPNSEGDTQILSKFGHIAVYLDTTPDFAGGTTGTSGRTGLTSYAGATDGLLVLDLAPVFIDANSHTLSSTFDFLTSSGGGSMYLGVTGAGAWDSLYDTNTQDFNSDFSFTFTARNNVNPTIGDWVVRGDAGGEGNAVPEPTSMLLFGTGLFGLVGAKLRRKTA